MTSGFKAFAAKRDVSRETLERLAQYHALLRKWNPKINLVAPNTLDQAWKRHFQDSAQLYEFAPEKGHWVDLGSGGGFPGAVIGILAADRPELKVTLVESDQRKSAFLRTVARETRADFKVVSERIESTEPLNADILSARALASVNVLLEFAERHLSPKGNALFLKGRKAEVEVAEALENWAFDCETWPSETDPEAVILKIGGIERV